MMGAFARGVEASDKVSKAAVDYSRGHKDSHCGPAFDGDKGYCRYFVEPKSGGNNGECERVAGSIGRFMWCKLFRKAKKP